jgi:hypothetical protein
MGDTRDIDSAIEYELRLSERLQAEILKEYKSLDVLLERYESYRNDESLGMLRHGVTSFFDYYEMKEHEDKNKPTESADDLLRRAPTPLTDPFDQLPLMPSSEFLEKVGKAFAKLPQSTNE